MHKGKKATHADSTLGGRLLKIEEKLLSTEAQLHETRTQVELQKTEFESKIQKWTQEAETWINGQLDDTEGRLMAKLHDLDPRAARDILTIMGEIEAKARDHLLQLNEQIGMIEENINQQVSVAVAESIYHTSQELKEVRGKTDEAICELKDQGAGIRQDIEFLKVEHSKCVEEIMDSIRIKIKPAVTTAFEDSGTTENIASLQRQVNKMEKSIRQGNIKKYDNLSIPRHEANEVEAEPDATATLEVEAEPAMEVEAEPAMEPAPIRHEQNQTRRRLLRVTITCERGTRNVYLASSMSMQKVAESYLPGDYLTHANGIAISVQGYEIPDGLQHTVQQIWDIMAPFDLSGTGSTDRTPQVYGPTGDMHLEIYFSIAAKPDHTAVPRSYTEWRARSADLAKQAGATINEQLGRDTRGRSSSLQPFIQRSQTLARTRDILRAHDFTPEQQTT